MAVEVEQRRFSVVEFAAMAAAHVFAPDERVELLDGEILRMNPIGPGHAAIVRHLDDLLRQQVGDQAIVSVQCPIVLDATSQPQPDLALLRPRSDNYAGSHPRPQDILLMIEVADGTVVFDTTRKARAYARSGIVELWVVDLPHRVVSQYRQPGSTGYDQVAERHAGEVLEASALPVRIPVDELILPPATLA